MSLKERLPVLNWSYCHRMPSRSFFWKGKQLPVCARCTGIHLGYLALPVFLFNLIELNVLWSLAIFLPTYIDGLIQAMSNWESKNWLRFSTGLLSGVGMMSLTSIIGKFIGRQLLFLIS